MAACASVIDLCIPALIATVQRPNRRSELRRKRSTQWGDQHVGLSRDLRHARPAKREHGLLPALPRIQLVSPMLVPCASRARAGGHSLGEGQCRSVSSVWATSADPWAGTPAAAAPTAGVFSA